MVLNLKFNNKILTPRITGVANVYTERSLKDIDLIDSVVMRESEESTPCLALVCCLLLKVLWETVQSGLVAVSHDSEEHA